MGASAARGCNERQVGRELPLRGAAEKGMLIWSFRCAGLLRGQVGREKLPPCGAASKRGRLSGSFRCAGLQREAD